ncbi:MAG: T9SS type A sorting domain-containing protein, partial [Rhodothermales bacterium]
TLSAPWPNPTRGSAQIAWYNSSAGLVDVALFDLLGRRVHTVHSGFLRSGFHEARIDLGMMAPGVYLVRFKGFEFVRTRPLVLTH